MAEEGAKPEAGQKPGSTDEPGKTPEPAKPEPAKGEEPKKEDTPLGPPGEKALEEWKKRAKAAEKTAKESTEKLAKFEEASKSEQEKALDKARKEATDAATAEVSGKFRTRILNAEVKARAAGKLAYPDDAPRLLDLDADELFDEDGEVKAADIDKAIEALIESRPRLKADPSDGRPVGDDDAGKGSGGEAKRLEDMTPADWEQEMYGSKK